MPALKNARHERFAKLVAMGMEAFKAHGEAGFRADRSNAIKLKNKPHVKARIEELQAEHAEREDLARGEIEGATGADDLRRVLQGAIAASNWSAAATAARHLAEADGSLAKLAPSATHNASREELCRALDAFGPVAGLAGRMLFSPGAFRSANADDADIALAAAGLAKWFSPAQLQTLGRRLSEAK